MKDRLMQADWGVSFSTENCFSAENYRGRRFVNSLRDGYGAVNSRGFVNNRVNLSSFDERVSRERVGATGDGFNPGAPQPPADTLFQLCEVQQGPGRCHHIPMGFLSPRVPTSGGHSFDERRQS